MSTRSGIRVAVRTRPTASFAADQLIIDTAKAVCVCAREPLEAVARAGVAARAECPLPAPQTLNVKTVASSDAVNNRTDSWAFKFHSVLHNAGQDAVYDTLCSEAVNTVVGGTNATIMAYGQTGAGKTFTMVRPPPPCVRACVGPLTIARRRADR